MDGRSKRAYDINDVGILIRGVFSEWKLNFGNYFETRLKVFSVCGLSAIVCTRMYNMSTRFKCVGYFRTRTRTK